MPERDTSGARLDRVVLHLRDGVRRVVDPSDVFVLDASGGDTRVRLRSKAELVDVRRLDALAPLFAPFGFHRIHRSYVVNLRRIRELRPRGRDWEVRLDPPVNLVLPVSRNAASGLFRLFGEK